MKPAHGLIAGAALAVAYALFFTEEGQKAVDKVATSFDPHKVQRSLALLQPDFRAKVVGYLADAKAAGFPLIVTETLRTPERQADVFATGASHTLHSTHLAHDPDGLARGVDTLTADFQATPAGEKKAVNDLDGFVLRELRARWGLKNLPSIKDYGHLEDA